MIPIPFVGLTDPISSLTHLLTACAALFGAGILFVRGRGNTLRQVSLMIFSVALVFLFSMSGVFHLLARGSSARMVLQRLDHAGIWTLIAATFTPIHVILFRAHWRWTILLCVWTVAITGLVIEVIYFEDFPEVFLLSLFLGLGWVGALSGLTFKRTYGDSSIRLLAAGGLLYSIGAVIDFSNWPILIAGILGPHEIFHLFVIAGAASHWAFIYRWCDHPVNNSLTFAVYIHSDHVIARAIGESIEIHAASVEEAKQLIRTSVAERYHVTVTPKIRLRYFHEEHLV